jgi:hypothetical protein
MIKLILEPNDSEATFSRNLMLDGTVRLAETTSVAGIISWRWEDDPSMKPEPLGRVVAGHSLRVPFEFKGRSVHLFLESETADGVRSTRRIEEAVQTVFTPPARVYSGEADVEAGEDLAAFDLVNVYNDGGTAKARKADASDSSRTVTAFVREAATVGDSLVVGQTVRLFFGGNIITTSGRTPGAVQYLSETAGEMTETAPTGSTKAVQVIGRAISDTEVIFEPDEPEINP